MPGLLRSLHCSPVPRVGITTSDITRPRSCPVFHVTGHVQCTQCQPPGNRLKGGGGGTTLPPSHCPDSTRKALPYPNTSPNRVSNRQKPPNRFHIPCDRPATALRLPQWPPSPPSKALPPPSKGEHVRTPGSINRHLCGTPPPPGSRQTPAWTRSVHLDAPGRSSQTGHVIRGLR